MRIGYARIFADEQSLDLQRDALQRAGCEDVFEDSGISGSTTTRPGLDPAFSRLGEGAVLTVWKADRLGRSLPHPIEMIRLLGESGAGFASFSENIDTTSAGGKLVFYIMGALAEFERSLTVERVAAEIVAVKKRGKHIGRPWKLTPRQVVHARDAIGGGMQNVAGLAVLPGIDREPCGERCGRRIKRRQFRYKSASVSHRDERKWRRFRRLRGAGPAWR